MPNTHTHTQSSSIFCLYSQLFSVTLRAHIMKIIHENKLRPLTEGKENLLWVLLYRETNGGVLSSHELFFLELATLHSNWNLITLTVYFYTLRLEERCSFLVFFTQLAKTQAQSSPENLLLMFSIVFLMKGFCFCCVTTFTA